MKKKINGINDFFSTEDKKLFLKELLKLNKSQIYGGTADLGADVEKGESELNDALLKVAGFRFFGQRYTPDAHILQRLVYPAVGEYKGKVNPFTMILDPDINKEIRNYAIGLDVMSVFGSKVAEDILISNDDHNYNNYDNNVKKLRAYFNSMDEKQWNKNLYFSWIYTLKSIINEDTAGYPTFFTTKAWKYKSLNTALASWAELKHDTILYAKQPYGMNATSTAYHERPEPTLPKGYVEPNPEFYARLSALTNMTIKGLESMDLLPYENKYQLEQFNGTLKQLIAISIKELEGKKLDNNDYRFIKNFNLKAFYPADKDKYGGKMDVDKGAETTMVADILTRKGKCVEEGVGYVRSIVVAYKLSDGTINLGVGPVFSYYEFDHPVSDRLTDEKWRDILKKGIPKNPSWIKEFHAK